MLVAACDLQLPPGHPLVGALDPEQLAAHTYPQWYERGQAMLDNGDVLAIDVTADGVSGIVRSTSQPGGYGVSIAVTDDRVATTCDCPVADRHRTLWCKHRIALALAVVAAGRPGQLLLAPPEATFVTGQPVDDVPVEWTLVAPASRVRHLAVRRKKGETERRALCGQPGRYSTATSSTALPVCRRCTAARTRSQAAKAA